MKYKVGDRVRVQSLDWYKKNKNNRNEITFENNPHWRFVANQSDYCGKIATIISVSKTAYRFENIPWNWTDEMIEGLVEEETKFGTASNPIEPKSNANCLTLERVDALATKIDKELPSWNQNVWELPNGYQFTDENGNVINTTKIVLEKKPDDKLKLESTKKVREYWSEYTRIYIEIYDDDPNECVLTHLYTFEGHRQKGHAKKALAEAELIAKELGCHKVHLKVETNSWMHNWYLRCGYSWYKNANEGYTWLTKNL